MEWSRSTEVGTGDTLWWSYGQISRYQRLCSGYGTIWDMAALLNITSTQTEYLNLQCVSLKLNGILYYHIEMVKLLKMIFLNISNKVNWNWLKPSCTVQSLRTKYEMCKYLKYFPAPVNITISQDEYLILNSLFFHKTIELSLIML